MKNRWKVLTVMLLLMLFSVNSYAESVIIEQKLEIEEQLKVKEYESFDESYLSEDEIKLLEAEKKLSQFTQSEIDLLCAVIWAESDNKIHEEKVAIAKVLLNRLNSGFYGETVKKMVYAKYQFDCIHRKEFGYFTDEDLQALKLALVDTKYPNNMVWFANASISTNRGFINRTLLPNKFVKIGKTTFSTNPKLPE